ncbi:hypothetical protein AST20_17940 [Acinetobacter baumannii]|uniref:DUF2280 domain-containing protein n=1 Tax=Acinetobacter baumannii TaxID=470 RepID=UPI00070C2585|nr:hypothetical protein AST20_17940 [Acinetobacter baumannii]
MTCIRREIEGTEFKLKYNFIDFVELFTYDPTKYSGRNLSQKYVELFESTREKFDEGLIDIPIANKYYRLKQYQRQLDRTRNVKTALKILEQAAKDIGGQFTNRQEITGKDGGPLQTVNSDVPVPMEEYLKARREVLDEY